MTQFVRAVFPMLIVLRLADQKDPVMDKLFFYVRRMDMTIEKSKNILDLMEERTLGISWRVINDIQIPSFDDGDSESLIDDNDNDSLDSSDDDSTQDGTDQSLGQRVTGIWFKRRDKLVTDFSIAGWLLSPIPQVYNDCKQSMTGEHRNAVERLLIKMMGSEFADDSDELASLLYFFWEEFEQFQSRSGPYEKSHIWNLSINRDLLLGKSYLWHKKNSYFQTKVLGKFACRVCSKIVGMGSAERNWGDVKHLKTEKRSHLSSATVEKQATIFGASCMADADIERKKIQASTTECYKLWDEEDFDEQFDMLSVDFIVRSNQRVLKCYMESWEKEHIRKKDDVSKAKFLHKYGGLEFEDVDRAGIILKICDKDMKFRRRSKKDKFDNGGWSPLAYTTKAGDKPIPWPIFEECALHDCLATYYRKHPELNVKTLLKKDQVEGVEWLMSLRKEDEEKSNDSNSTDSESDLDQAKTANFEGQAKDDGNMMSPCGGCGGLVGPVHKCDRCNSNMHPFCGRTIGEEGYGSFARCPKCDK
jgi:hypothetical protein